jgi:hypothetical protein
MTDIKTKVSRAPSDAWHENTGYSPPKDKTMTAPTLEERTKLMSKWNAKIAARIEADQEKAAFIKAAGGLASDKTLRDEFAGQAMIGWMSAADHDDYLDPKFVTSLSYEFADAMLEARKTTGEGE